MLRLQQTCGHAKCFPDCSDLSASRHNNRLNSSSEIRWKKNLQEPSKWVIIPRFRFSFHVDSCCCSLITGDSLQALQSPRIPDKQGRAGCSSWPGMPGSLQSRSHFWGLLPALHRDGRDGLHLMCHPKCHTSSNQTQSHLCTTLACLVVLCISSFAHESLRSGLPLQFVQGQGSFPKAVQPLRNLTHQLARPFKFPNEVP